MAKIAVIGDRDSVLGFRALGLEVHTVEDSTEARHLLRKAAEEGCAAVFLTEALAAPLQEEIDRYVSKNAETGEVMQVQPNAKVGDLKFIDTNGDGVITDADKVLTGCYTPKQTFSFGASLDWKGFDFSFMFQGVAGNYIYNGTKQMGMNGHGGDFGNLIEDVFDTWDFNPSGSKYPRLGLAEDNNGNYTKFSDAFLEKGDYLRLKNITLGYTLPAISV